MLRKLIQTVPDHAITFVRLVLGVVFFAHGAQKALGWFGGYGFSGKSALRSVALEIPMSPVKGLSSSKIRKIAQANDSAHTIREAVTTRLVCANKVKLTKIAISQKTRITKNGVGIEPPACANNCSRVCAPSVKA